jgi:mRNA interferase RelE/StbE
MFEILLTASAVHDYRRIPENEIDKINKAIDLLEKNPRPAGYKKLQNRNAYRIRAGNFRIIYEIRGKELVILVIRIRNRKEVYKNLP